MIQSPKLMTIVVWNPSGLHLVSALPKGLKFNAGYYIRKGLSGIKNWLGQQRVGSARRLGIHADDVIPHASKRLTDFLDANRVTRAFHPPYSPDIAPSDFFYFEM
jgi:histone-lysine N-methyltransferase SETMAR